MRIVNTTGFSQDTRVYDETGKEITAELRVTRIVIEAGERNRVTLTCEDVELDVVGDRVEGGGGPRGAPPTEGEGSGPDA